jgi:hypothetical protein
MTELTPTQQAIAENDARESAKIQFDPKVHGVGTVAPVAPDSVQELFKRLQSLEARIADIENTDLGRLVRGEVSKAVRILGPTLAPAQSLAGDMSQEESVEESGGSQVEQPAQQQKSVSAFSKSKVQ